MKQLLRVYLVMGSVNCEDEPETVLEKAISGGITLFQYREKGDGALTGTERLETAVRLKKRCHAHGVPFIVNDDVNLAMKVDADGVHVGQEDECAETVRKRIGNKILGVSAHDVREAEAAVRQGADYLGVGPMYWTGTKEDIREVRGPDVIREIRRFLPAFPIVGIGGITPSRVRPVMEAGADGVAVISAITRSADPHDSTKHISREMESYGP